ncbi:MAG: cell division topological specificity factor MinE [Coxiella sp. RIFCSPHIGHO2_12_FULL_42_15]|nr:MAG: cell division topological specificity factor MinE [Coxiella sp. RIFCSPHIGHO2_12_FULL_42_15]
MNVIDYFKRKKSANVAKGRLQIIIAQQRAESSSPDYLPMLRKEILDVVARYTNVDINTVKVDFHCNQNNSILELNVQLPDAVLVE